VILRTLSEWLAARIGERGEARLIIAVSGGADSTALAAGLAEAAAELGRRANGPTPPPRVALVLAHYRHGLRARDEEACDLDVVESLAQRYGLPLLTESAPAGSVRAAATIAGGVESAARAARYSFLDRACRATGFRTVCTAHHRDDQVETVLMRLLAGQTGNRLAGIPHERELESGATVCRPLLTTPPDELRRYLDELGLRWNDDHTNERTEHLRNRVRLYVLPQVETCWPAVRSDLSLLARSMAVLRSDAQTSARSVAVQERDGSVRVRRIDFYRLEPEARLELAYETMTRLGLLRRSDRPARRFFAPLQGPDPGDTRRVIGARGMEVLLEGDYVVFRAYIARYG